MISIHHRTRNPYSLFGLEHFITKYGIPVEVNLPGQRDIGILYGMDGEGTYTIRLAEKEIRPDITGMLRLKDNKIPLFEIPGNSGEDGDVVAWYEGDRGSYPCITCFEDHAAIGIDIFAETGHLLSGNLETFWKTGRAADQEILAGIPLVDRLEDLLFQAVLRGCGRLRVPLAVKSFWPEGKQYAVCLTHDVDEVRKTYQWITYPLKLVRKGDIRSLGLQFHSLLNTLRGKDPYWTFDQLTSLEEQLSVRSTYFFLQETAPVRIFQRKTWKHAGRRYRWNEPRIAALIRDLAGRGMDIGLHGSYDSYNELSLIRKEKAGLEAVLNAPVPGTRQHNLNLAIPGTWLIHEKAGFSYDSTLGFNNRLGFRWGTCFPFQPWNPREKRPIELLEIPLVIQDTTFFRDPDHEAALHHLQGEVKLRQGVLTLLWHHAVFNTLEFPGWMEEYREIIESSKMEEAWVTHGRDIADWWRRRESTGIEASFAEGLLTLHLQHGDKDCFITLYHPGAPQPKGITRGSVIRTDPGRTLIRIPAGPGTSIVTVEFPRR